MPKRWNKNFAQTYSHSDGWLGYKFSSSLIVKFGFQVVPFWVCFPGYWGTFSPSSFSSPWSKLLQTTLVPCNITHLRREESGAEPMTALPRSNATSHHATAITRSVDQQLVHLSCLFFPLHKKVTRMLTQNVFFFKHLFVTVVYETLWTFRLH